jgi:spore germination cell wall hydrolase CwlJ-like protein
MVTRRQVSRFFNRMFHRRWARVRLSWDLADKEPWVFGGVVVALAVAFGIALNAFSGYKVDRARAIAEHHDERKNLMCLARNVYFEARGEPMKGQRAVAEVTLNRVASGNYPDSICDVVYQKGWDASRKRYVGAFSWTEFKNLPNPAGEAWKQAWQAAEEVYFGTEPPVVEGAMHFHAVYIKPDWAHGRRPIAKIGQHVFYK